ncbi:hypothetical protein BD413DRAFT_632098 [Trametes elegans]|nr:hypothetical protein BD413DRAFT_632098 [Trametes elegans]
MLGTLKAARKAHSTTHSGQTDGAVPYLPVELWGLILREAQFDDLLPRYRWLRWYALVCKAWRPYAQQLLFSHVALRGSSHCKAFSSAILSSHSLAHARSLQNSVHTISMVMDHQAFYADAVQLCPRLRELHLCMYHACFRPETYGKLAAAPRSIRALRVRAYHYAALYQLLALFPHVEYIEIDCSGITAPLPDPPPAPPPAWRLRELRYANPRRATHGFVEWALSGPGAGSRDTLEALRVQCPTFSPSLLPELGVTGLRSLAVPRVMRGDDLSGLARLEDVWLTCPRYPSPTFLTLPLGVRHLALHVLGDSDYEDVIAELGRFFVNTGGGIESITYNRRCDEDDSVEDVVALHEFCQSREIAFKLMDPPYGYYAGEHIPFEPVSSCPREMPVSKRRAIQGALLEDVLQWPFRKPTLSRKVGRKMKKALKHTIPAAAFRKR